ncbi:MAG: hypothetical protein ABSD50_14850 [Smithella sp.]|jgi:hypothetical protein
MGDQGDQTFDNLTVNKDATLLGNVYLNGTPHTGPVVDESIYTGNLSVAGQVGIGTRIPSVRGIINTGPIGSLFVIGGNVGFGTLRPAAGLQIDKGSTNDVALMLSSTGPGWGSGVQFKNNDILYGIFAGSECFHICDQIKQVDRLIIDANGNVGIGTTKPSAQLDVTGDIRINDRHIWLRGINNTGVGDTNHGIGYNTQFDGPMLFGWGGGALGTNGGQKTVLSWNQNGNVGIGTSTPQHTLDVIGDINANGNLTVANNLGIGTPTPKYNLDVVGTINASVDVVVGGADCAEDFEVSPAETVDPGMVMALNDDGKLVQSKHPYDKRVAGVISGAGDLKPGLVLGRQPGHVDRVPLALMGRVNCKVDAEYESVEVGDLLTTSKTPGHAMKASDPTKSFGTVIGKALRPLKVGQNLIPILVTLQ